VIIKSASLYCYGLLCRAGNTRRDFIGVVLTVMASLCAGTGTAQADQPVRLGWQIPWATQGQLVMGLKHTNIPQLTAINLAYTGFSYGGPLNRAALSGDVDVLLTADQPALVLMSRSDRFSIIARMMYNRVCLYVPPESPIQTLADLRGRRVMGPVGAAAERIAMAAISRAGVPLHNIDAGSLDMAQQSALLKTAQGRREWRGVDALYGFDPLPAVFETSGQARMLHCGKVVSVVVGSKDMVDKRPVELRNFLRAFALSWAYFATQPTKANKWFANESKLGIGDDVLDKAASIEPNRWVTDPTQIRLNFTGDDREVFREALEFLVVKKIVKNVYDFESRINLRPLTDAMTGFDLAGELRKVVPTE